MRSNPNEDMKEGYFAREHRGLPPHEGGHGAQEGENTTGNRMFRMVVMRSVLAALCRPDLRKGYALSGNSDPKVKRRRALPALGKAEPFPRSEPPGTYGAGSIVTSST